MDCIVHGVTELDRTEQLSLSVFNPWLLKYNSGIGRVCAQPGPTLCDSMDYPPGSSVHGVLQARILEWVVMPSSRGSSQPSDWTHVPRIAGRFFTI